MNVLESRRFFSLICFRRFVIPCLFFIGLAACGGAEDNASADEAVLNTESDQTAVIEPNLGTPISLPDPRSYVAAPDSSIGVNANGKGLEVGTHIESRTIKDMTGADYVLSDAWQSKPALIVFYRGGWCPYCNMQVRELSVYYAKLQSAGVQPILISVDEPDAAALLGAQYEIPFPVLSDPDLMVHQQFNVVLTLDEETVDIYKNQYDIDLSAWSGRDHHSFAVASAFIIDTDGVVKASHAPEDYSQRPSIDQLLKLIEMSGVSTL